MDAEVGEKVSQAEGVAWNALLLIEAGCDEATATRFAKQWSDKCAQLADAKARNEVARKALEEVQFDERKYQCCSHQTLHQVDSALEALRQFSGGGNG